MRFKQICNHAALWTGSGNFDEQASGKFRRLREIAAEIAARGEKLLLFTQFCEMCAPLLELLEDPDIFARPGLELHGGTPVGRRQRLVEQFQREGGPPFFVISLRAGGAGLNLTAASHVVHFDRWWNPAVEDQATDRAFRIGQKRNVLVHKFVCAGTIEDRIDRLIADKRETADRLLGAGDGAGVLLTEMSDEELLDFVAVDLDTRGDLAGGNRNGGRSPIPRRWRPAGRFRGPPCSPAWAARSWCRTGRRSRWWSRPGPRGRSA